MIPRTPRAAAAVVGAAAFLAQLPGVTDTFLFDDFGLVVRSDLYTSPARWIESVTVPLARVTVFYRPAATTSFLLESLVHGGVAWGFRLTAALLFALSAVVAFVLLRRLAGTALPAALGALVWALHPVQVEAATWIAGRFDLLAVLLTLAALASLPSSAAWTPWRVGLAVAVTSVACLAKESAFALPVLGALWLAAAEPPIQASPARARLLRASAVLAAGCAFAFFLRWEAVGQGFRGPETITSSAPPLQRVLLVGRSIAAYARLVVAPWGGVGPIHAGERPIPAGDAAAWAGLAAGAALVAGAFLAWRRGSRAAPLLAAFGVTLLPVIQIVPLDIAGGVHACDRYLLLPSFFLVAAGVAFLSERTAASPALLRGAAWAAAAFLAASLAYRTVLLHRWNDAERFWEWTVATAPGNPAAETNLAFVKASLGKFGEAEEHARRGGPEGVTALVDALAAQGRIDDAFRAADAALAESTPDRNLLVRRGELALAAKRFDLAAGDLNAAIDAERRTGADMEPVTARALAALAETIVSAGGPERETRLRLDEAARTAGPGERVTWLRIARVRLLLGEAALCREALARAAAAGAAPEMVRDLEAALARRGR